MLCNWAFTDIFCHCPVTFDLRYRWWSVIINSSDIPLVAELSGLSEDDIYMTLIGRHTYTPLDKYFHASFYLANFRLVRSCAAQYFRALRSNVV